MTTLDLYRTAIAADDLFSAILKEEGLERYTWQNHAASSRLRRAYRSKLEADAALHAAYAKLSEIRRNAHCE